MYGFVCYRDASLSIMHSAAEGSRRGLGRYPVLTLQDEPNLCRLGKAFDLMYSDGSSTYTRKLEGKFPTIYESPRKFSWKPFALYWILLHDIEKFRDMNPTSAYYPFRI